MVDPIDTSYDPKYISLQDVPVSGPDDYTDQDKRRAVFDAETRLEGDINDGTEIDSSNVTNLHKDAVMQLATHVLTHAAEEPSNTTLGDMSDTGSVITNYSSRYKENYMEIVETIRESSQTAGGVDNFTYTTSS